MDNIILLALEDERGLTRRELATSIGKEVTDTKFMAMLESLLVAGKIKKAYRGNAYYYSLPGNGNAKIT